MAWRRHLLVLVAAALLPGLSGSAGLAQPAQVNTIKEAVAKLGSCWRPPPRAQPGIDITVIVSFNRAGEILGPVRDKAPFHHAWHAFAFD